MDKRAMIYENPELQGILQVMLNALDDAVVCEFIQYNKTCFLENIFNSAWHCRNTAVASDQMLDWVKYDSIEYLGHDADVYFALEEGIRKVFAYILSKVRELRLPLSYLDVTPENLVTVIIEKNSQAVETMKKDLVFMAGNAFNFDHCISVSFREQVNIIKEIESICNATFDSALFTTDVIEMISQPTFGKNTLQLKCKELDINKYLLRSSNIITQPYEEHRTFEDTIELTEEQKERVHQSIFTYVCKTVEALQNLGFYATGSLVHRPLPVDSNGVCFFVSNRPLH